MHSCDDGEKEATVLDNEHSRRNVNISLVLHYVPVTEQLLGIDVYKGFLTLLAPQ